eukprot:scaffold13039_cov46-Phaeocystis_antarctica.AAC.2
MCGVSCVLCRVCRASFISKAGCPFPPARVNVGFARHHGATCAAIMPRPCPAARPRRQPRAPCRARRPAAAAPRRPARRLGEG